ncbi:branched-chain amino acid ABC transporter permease [Streptomyces sp. SID8111]|nr:branched-chain amino acid ABC transporter permease [Streptomyces sp. SID8111]
MFIMLMSGLVVGAVYALVAVGYNITFLSAGVLNFAFAYMVVLGSFLSWAGRDSGVPMPLLLLAGAGLGALLGLVEERVAIRPIKNKGSHTELITTVGFATVVTGVILLVWGADVRKVPSLVGGSIGIGSADIAFSEVLILIMALALATGFGLWSRRSRLGLASLAQAEDREAAMVLGVDVRRLSLAAFAAAGLLAVVLGFVVGPKTFAVPESGALLAVKGFVVLALGGVGSYLGAVIAGLTIGVLESVASYAWSSEVQGLTVFLLFIVVLAVRPQGMFGQRAGRVV